MTKNERMMLKVEKELQEVQNRARTRLLEVQDIKRLLEIAQEKIKKLDGVEKKYFKGINFTLNYGVANAYKYPADTTEVRGKINKYGNIKEVFVRRTNAPKNGMGKNEKLIFVYE